MRYIISLLFLLASLNLAYAQQMQEIEQPTDTTTVVIVRKPVVDSTLIGVNLVNYVEKNNRKGSVKVNHPSQVDSLFVTYLEANAEKKIPGYRIRLFFDNKQTARDESQKLEKDFKLRFPTIPIYRTYTNPFFKIVVGDYRTKSDATKALQEIVIVYPKAIIIKENISFPEV